MSHTSRNSCQNNTSSVWTRQRGKPNRKKCSAFKAVNTSSIQVVEADVLTQLNYPDVVFDLNKEYHPSISTFIPRRNGIYLIIGSINFGTDEIASRVLINIEVNGEVVVSDNDFWDLGTHTNVIAVSGILKLMAGDKITISMESSSAGDTINRPTVTHFEGARLATC